jgi:outer membrane protein assembly factor BamA
MDQVSHRNDRSRWRNCCLAATAWIAMAASADEPHAGAMPTFAELEAAGAVIGDIEVITNDIFDMDDPRENNFLYRLANTLHVKTRPSVIRRQLLFQVGDPVSARLIDETERLLRNNDYINDVQIRAVAVHGNVVAIQVKTRDTWSLQPGGSFSREGGENKTGISISEQNLLGTGISIGFSEVSDVDRSGTEFEFGQQHAFGNSWTSIDAKLADYEDGHNNQFGIQRPFYALDTRWAAGITGNEFRQVDSIYNAGEIIGQYQHYGQNVSAWGGWSRGLIDGWAHRYSIGLNHQEDRYEYDASLSPPTTPPEDQTLNGPFVRWEVVEDDFQKVTNRERIQRPEYFAMGFHSLIQVGRPLKDLGSTRSPWLYSAAISDGFRPFGRHDLLTEVKASGEYEDGNGEHQLFSGSARYYAPQTERALFFFGIQGAYTPSEDPADQLLIGGDSGLRGYPLRYQSGQKRLLFTIEERIYTDWYPFRLFRIGGAVFADLGRAWGGPIQNTADPGWLADVGFGLRVLSDRSSYGKIYHIDLAFPIANDDPNIKSPQFLIKSRSYF